MTPQPCISLTTDFGHQGPFVAVMKAVIASRCKNANIIDLMHDIPVHWPPEAGFWLARAFPYFPPATVHIAVVDPGVGTERDILCADIAGHQFLAPDNGLLAPLLKRYPEGVCRAVDIDALLVRLSLPAPSQTFHGRDLFAPLAAELAAGTVTCDETGPQTKSWVPSQLEAPVATPGLVAGTVVTIDTFGNLITNIDAAMIRAFKQPVVSVAGQRLALSATYGRVDPGAYLALINSFDVVEIARAEASASAGLGLARGAPVRVTDAG